MGIATIMVGGEVVLPEHVAYYRDFVEFGGLGRGRSMH